jgi:hypothetical protein
MTHKPDWLNLMEENVINFVYTAKECESNIWIIRYQESHRTVTVGDEDKQPFCTSAPSQTIVNEKAFSNLLQVYIFISQIKDSFKWNIY